MKRKKTSDSIKRPVAVQIRKLMFEDEFMQTYPLVIAINPELTELDFKARQQALFEEGYQCYGVFEGQKLLAMCGFWIRHRFCYGKSLHIDNIVTTPELRQRGIASLLLRRVIDEAKANNCDVVALDTYVDNKQAQQFYLRNSMQIAGLHFTYNIETQAIINLIMKRYYHLSSSNQVRLGLP